MKQRKFFIAVLLMLLISTTVLTVFAGFEWYWSLAISVAGIVCAELFSYNPFDWMIAKNTNKEEEDKK